MYTQKKLSDCLQGIADRHESEGTLPTSSITLAYWTRLLNRGILYCADRLRLAKPTTLTTSSGIIALPDDFLMIDSVFDGDTEYFKVDPQDENQHVGTVYWITGNQTDGFNLNTPDDKLFTANYVFKPTPLVGNSDVCIIPDEEAVVAYAYAQIRKGESDPFEDAETALQECDARLKEIQSTAAINSDSIGFEVL